MRPFFYPIVDKLNEEISTSLGIELLDTNIAISYFTEGSKKYRIGENQALYQDTKLTNYFHYLNKIKPIPTRHEAIKNPSVEMDFYFVIIRPITQEGLWSVLGAFSKNQNLFYRSGDKTISGQVEMLSISDEVYDIGKKWIPDQLVKIEKNQTVLEALEISYRLTIENICDFCVD